MPFGEWLLQTASRLENPALLEEAVLLHQQLRFDPAPALPEARVRLEELTAQLASALKQGVRRAA
jgi:hypothetical protein